MVDVYNGSRLPDFRKSQVENGVEAYEYASPKWNLVSLLGTSALW